jgi:hypothetical protein
MSSPQKSRPFLVTLLALAVLSIAGLSLLRLALAVQQWQFLAGYAELSPAYLALSGLLGFVLATPLFIGLWRWQPWSRRAAPAFAIGYALYFWLDRLLLHRASPHENWPFLAIVSLTALAFTFWATRSRPT